MTTDPVDAAELSRLLSGTSLAGRSVLEVGGRRLAVRCDPAEVWTAWSQARSVLPDTGRRPVVVTSFDTQEPWDASLLSDDADPEAVVAASRAVDPWSTFTHWSAEVPLDAGHLGRLIEDDPDLVEADAPRLIAAGATLFDVEQVSWDRRLARTGRPAADPWLTDRGHLWFTPTARPCAVVFLPVVTSWDVAARVHYFGADDLERRVALVAIVREWSERYGAELVASFTTMLQFTVSRPPASPADAWELAGQQLSVGYSLEHRRSDLAAALMHADAWFLHARP